MTPLDERNPRRSYGAPVFVTDEYEVYAIPANLGTDWGSFAIHGATDLVCEGVLCGNGSGLEMNPGRLLVSLLEEARFAQQNGFEVFRKPVAESTVGGAL